MIEPRLTEMQRKYLRRLESRDIPEDDRFSSRFLPTLEALERRGLAERIEDCGDYAWRLTDAGRAAIGGRDD